jgi:hypothetical protein
MNDIKIINIKVPQSYLDLINQVFEIEKKAANLTNENSIQRNINKIKTLIESDLFKGNEAGFSYHNPIGEKYSETRTDCEATISGDDFNNLEIIEVIKPIIFCSIRTGDQLKKTIVQPAVVVVKSKIQI